MKPNNKNMKKENSVIPKPLIDKWQKVVDSMAGIFDVPAGLIMRDASPYMEVLLTSSSPNNPYKIGRRDLATGLYCEAVVKSRKELLVANALKDLSWNHNPDIKLGMISYLGFPLLWPDGDVFGAICVLDSKENQYNKRYRDILQKFGEMIESDLELMVSMDKLNEEIRNTKDVDIKLKDALDIAHLGQWELDLQTKQLRWSKEVYRIFEVDPNKFEASYSAFLEAIHPDDKDAVDRAYSESLKSRDPYDIVHRLRMKDGRVKYVRELCRTDFDNESVPLVSRGTVQDITLLKEQENEIREANKRLKEMDQLKSIFIASMSHELRTPLNSIIGFSGLMLKGIRGAPNEGHIGFLKRVETAGLHLLNLITDVIDISKIETGRIDISVSSFLFEEVVAEAVELTRVGADKKGLTLDVRVQSGIEMETDRRRLFQCLLNYLSNAVKYTEKGGLTITAEKRDEQVFVEVADTGIGIAETDISMMFEAFERLESHLKIKAGGTGLGLYLTKKLVVEILQGSIGFDSNQGEGSRFWLEVPRILSQESQKS